MGLIEQLFVNYLKKNYQTSLLLSNKVPVIKSENKILFKIQNISIFKFLTSDILLKRYTSFVVFS
jgi:hypothetical protein